MAWIALVASCVSFALAQEDPDYRAPVPIYAPKPTTPVETAGTGLAPEVGVRVLVDPSGRVAEVQVIEIEPSTELDAVIERATREALTSWRFAPATRGGQAEETWLEWVLQFPSRVSQMPEPEESEEPQRFGWQMLTQENDERASYRKFILSLPPQQRLERLKDAARRAERHLNPKTKRTYSSGHFIVITDANSPGVAEALAGNLEATFGVLHELLQTKIDPQPEPYKIFAFLYGTEASFDALKRDVRAHEWSAGFYSPLGMLAFHMERASDQSLMDTMLHEATHAFIDRYVAKPGVVFPRWLDEGFSDYMGASTIRKKKLVPGKTRRTEIYRSAWSLQLGRSATMYTVDMVKQAVRRDQAPTLLQIIEAEREEFYGDQVHLFYSMSWLLVHFLRHGEEQWAENEFPSLMLYIAEGYPAIEALRQVYGEAELLEPRFNKYVLGF